MTDPTDLDVLASAYLDDEVTDEERARIEADPELLALVQRMRAAAAAVGATVPPLEEEVAAAQRRRAISAGQDPAPVAPPARSGASRGRPVWLPSPAAAAAVLVVLALVGVLLMVGPGRGGDDADQAASSGGGATTTAAESDNSLREESSDGADDSTQVEDLGRFATEAELREALEERVDVTSLAPEVAVPATSAESYTEQRIGRCDRTVEAQGDLGTRLAVASAELDGTPVLVFSHPVTGDAGATPRTQLTVVDAGDCRVLFAVLR